MGQNATQYAESQHIGSVKMFYSPYSDGTTFTEVGIGEGFSYTETITALDGRPDNGTKPDILNGASEQSIEVTGTLWALPQDIITALRGGLDSYTVDSVTGETTRATGGRVTIEPVVIKLENRTQTFATADDVTRWVTTPSAPSVTFAEGDKIIKVLTTIIFKCTASTGETITYVSDQETNPILKYPITLSGEEDDTITDGSGNLFKVVETVELPS